jgi:acyl-CoA synthetase (AMP-forming)/AMP-acid ligase II
VLGVKAPRAILLVDEFPRNAMGNVLKKECAAMLAARPIGACG